MKKALSIIGMVVGLAFVVIGILAMTGVFGGNTSYPGYAPLRYDSGYATFGTDYYTYSVNNAAEAAEAAQTAARNVHSVAGFLLTCGGIFSILFGLMIICAFGIVLCSCCKKAEPLPVNDIIHTFEY